MPPHNYFADHKILSPAVAKTSSNAAEPSATQEKKMSLLSKVENGVKTLAHDAEDAVKLFVKDEPKIEAVVATTLSTISPLVIAVTGIVTASPAAAVAAAAILSSISTKLAAAQVIVVSLSSAASAKSLLVLVQADLGQLTALVGVKDPAALAAINADVAKVVSALTVIVAAL
jgi:hypothetical protein